MGLTALVNKENIPVTNIARVGQFDVFTADFFAWRLCYSEQTPCIWIKSEQLNRLSPEELVSNLHKSCLQGGWLNRVVLVFIDGTSPEIAEALKAWRFRFILLNEVVQQAMQNASSPKALLIAETLRWRSLQATSPYDVNKPVTGPAFFGQHDLIQKPLQNPHTSYLFVAAHRMGKTSLLKEIKRRLDEQDPPRRGHTRRVYIDCTVINREEDLLKMLVSRLEQSGFTLVSRLNTNPEQYQEGILGHYASLHGGTITFLLDEFDRLLPHINKSWAIIDQLKKSIAEKQVRLIAAGYRNAIRATLNKNSPFYNLLTPIWLEPLSQTAVEKLVLVPLTQLGITIEHPSQFAEAVREQTAGLPNLLQFYCRKLLAYLDETNKRTLSRSDLSTIYFDPSFRGVLLNTFMSNTDIVERALVYAMVVAEVNGVERANMVPTLSDLLLTQKLSLTTSQIKEACDNLRQAGIFRQEETRYTFAIPNFAALLREERDVQFLFERAREALQTDKILA